MRLALTNKPVKDGINQVKGNNFHQAYQRCRI